MAPNDPPRDDEDLTPDQPEENAAPEIEGDGDAPEAHAADAEDAVDAVIVEGDTAEGADETSADELTAEDIAVIGEDVEERAENEGMALADDEPEDTPVPDAEAANENDEAGGSSLAAPFAIIVGALVVIAALVVFLNRNHSNDAPVTASRAPEIADPIASGPAAPTVASPIGHDDHTEEPIVVAAGEDHDEDVPHTHAEDHDDAAVDHQADDPIVVAAGEEHDETVPHTHADEHHDDTDHHDDAADEPPASASDMVAELASADDAAATDETAEEAAARRSALIARAAERNRARRAAREASLAPETADEETTEADDAADMAHADTEDAADAVVAAVETNDTADAAETVASAEETAHDEDAGTEEFAAAVAPIADEQVAAANEALAAADNNAVAEEEVVVIAATEDSAAAVAETETETVTVVASEPQQPAPDLEELRSNVKADVLAETEQVIDQKFEQTAQEVKALRTEVTEQQRLANERLAALSRKIDTIETSELTAARQSTLLLALSDLDDSVRSGEPFARELDNIERIAPEAGTLNLLRDYAATGLPTDTELRASYALAARQALSGVKRAEAEGPLERLGANLSGLFTVRKVGDIPGDTPSAVIARGEARLTNGDLEGAVEELDALTGVAGDAFADWIEAAEARVEAERRIKAMERAVAARAG